MGVPCPVRCLFSSNQCYFSNLLTDAATEVNRICELEVERFRKLYNFDLMTTQPVNYMGSNEIAEVKASDTVQVPWMWQELYPNDEYVPPFYWGGLMDGAGTQPMLEYSEAQHMSSMSSGTTSMNSHSVRRPAGLRPMKCNVIMGTTSLFVLWMPHVRKNAYLESNPKVPLTKPYAPNDSNYRNPLPKKGKHFARSRSCEQQSVKGTTVGGVIGNRGCSFAGRETERSARWSTRRQTYIDRNFCLVSATQYHADGNQTIPDANERKCSN